MIYFLRNPAYPQMLTIGTAAWVSGGRGRLAAAAILSPVDREMRLPGVLPPQLQRLECLGMMEGGSAEAETIRELLWPETFRVEYLDKHKGQPDTDDWQETARAEMPWRVVDDAFLAWVAAHAKPWENEEQAILQIKPVPKHNRRPAKPVDIAARLARARRRS